MGFLPAQNLVDIPLDGLQLLEPLFLFVVGVIQAGFLGNKLLDLVLQRFSGGQLGNAMLPEVPGGCVGYNKVALMRLPVCGAGFLGFLCPQPVAGGLGLGVLSAIMGAFCLSSAACPFFCAQYSRSVTRFLLPFKRSI